MASPSMHRDLKALHRLINQADLVLATIDDPYASIASARESLNAALALSKHLAEREPDAAGLGPKAGTVTAQRGPEYYEDRRDRKTAKAEDRASRLISFFTAKRADFGKRHSTLCCVSRYLDHRGPLHHRQNRRELALPQDNLGARRAFPGARLTLSPASKHTLMCIALLSMTRMFRVQNEKPRREPGALGADFRHPHRKPSFGMRCKRDIGDSAFWKTMGKFRAVTDSPERIAPNGLKPKECPAASTGALR